MAQAGLEKIRAEIRKLSLESDKLMKETHWYPFVVVGAYFAATLVFVATLLNVLARIFLDL